MEDERVVTIKNGKHDINLEALLNLPGLHEEGVCYETYFDIAGLNADAHFRNIYIDSFAYPAFNGHPTGWSKLHRFIDTMKLWINLGETDYPTKDRILFMNTMDALDLKFIFKYLKEQTVELCINRVQRDGLALKDVRMTMSSKDYRMVCQTAIQRNGMALQFVKPEFQTNHICLEAVKQNGNALRYVENQTEEIVLAALRNMKVLIPSDCYDDYNPTYVINETVLGIKVQTPEIEETLFNLIVNHKE